MAKFHLKSDGKDALPSDEWLICESICGQRTYIFHTRSPRFIARVFDEDEGIFDTLSYSLPSGQSLAEFVWLDPVEWQTHPVEADLLDLFARAGEALAEYDYRLDLEV